MYPSTHPLDLTRSIQDPPFLYDVHSLQKEAVTYLIKETWFQDRQTHTAAGPLPLGRCTQCPPLLRGLQQQTTPQNPTLGTSEPPYHPRMEDDFPTAAWMEPSARVTSHNPQTPAPSKTTRLCAIRPILHTTGQEECGWGKQENLLWVTSCL